MPASPFKLNRDRRRHIPKQKYKVTNWREYDAALRRRGSSTVWSSDEAIRAWGAEPRTSRGGQPTYSALAILTALTLKAVFRLAYRRTEGLLGLGLAVPDHSTLCRRAETLADESRRAFIGRSRTAPVRAMVTTPAAVRMTMPGPCTCWWTARA